MNVSPAADVLTLLDRAILFLASRCDGATSRDAQGFNGSHAKWGRRCADYLKRGQPLRDENYRKAARYLVIYVETQLHLAEPPITALPTLAEVDAALTARAARTAAPPTFDRGKAARPGRTVLTFTQSGNFLTVKTPYDAAKVELLKKAIPASHRRYEGGAWRILPAYEQTMRDIYEK